MTKHYFNACILSFSIALSPSIWASTSDGNESLPSEIFSLSLKELLNIKISGSTLSDQARAEVPAAVTVLTHEQIQRMGITNIAELLNFVPGFQVHRSSDTGVYSMASSRARRTDASSTEILFLIDGQRSQALLNGGSSFFLEFPVDQIQRVEFLRGSGSAIYGSNAMMGVINIITIRNKNKLGLLVGEYNTTHLGFQWNKNSDKLNLHVSFEGQDSGGKNYTLYDAYDADAIPVSDPHTRYFSSINIDSGKFKLGIHQFQSKADDFYSFDSLQPGHNQTDMSHTTVLASWDLDTTNTKTKFKISQTDYELNIRGKFSREGIFSDISEPPSTEPLLYISSTDGSQKHLSVDSRWTVSPENQLAFGVEWRKEFLDKLDSRYNFDSFNPATAIAPVTYYPDYVSLTIFPINFDTQTVSSIYAQWQIAYSPDTHITLGLRGDSYKEIKEHQITPRIAFVHEFNENHALKLLYAHAFRAPSLSNLNTDSTWSRSDPTLRAETVETYEVIWAGQYNNIFWNAGHFFSHFKNPLLLEIEGSTRVITNADHDHFAGYELEINYQPNDRWMIRTTGTEIYEYAELAFRESKKMFSLQLNYSGGQRWNVNLSSAWRSGRDSFDPMEANSRRNLPAYWLTYSKLTYKFNKRLNIYAQASNLTDETVFYPSAGPRLPQGIPSRGSAWAVGMDWHF